MFNVKKRVLALAATAGAFVSGSAFATPITDAEAAITAASGDALVVGGYVVAAVAGLVVISLILGMVRKL